MNEKSYKVQFTKSFVISVTAESEAEAIEKAERELWQAEETNTAHYLVSGDTDTVVFDVTGTDDDFNQK